MVRAMWKGSISFGLVNIPVGLVSAEEKGSELAFHNLDRKTLDRVRQKRVAEASGEEVPWENVVKGYEYARGKYVVLEPEEIDAANPKASHTIDVVAAVCRECIDPPFFNKPYYVVPEGPGRKAYALLREVLRKNDQVAVARVVIRTRQYLAALFPEGPVLVLDLLRYADELRATDDLEVPADGLADAGATDQEFELAQQLVGSLSHEWNAAQYTDNYRNDLLELIKRKVEEGGRTITEMPGKPAAPESGEVIDIMDLLKRSIDAASAERAAKTPAEKPASRRKHA